MEAILRAGFMYLFLMFVVRIAGNRTLSEMTTFDFVLVMIIGDASQQAITGSDYSVVNGVIVILTFVMLDIIFTLLKYKYRVVGRIIDGTPVILVSEGKLIPKMMKCTKVDECDILEAGRKSGVGSLEQIQYAILEKNGEISIISYEK